MNSGLAQALLGFLILGLAAAVKSPNPQLSIKSSLGVTKQRGFSESFSTVAQEWSEGDKFTTGGQGDTKLSGQGGHGAVQEKSDGILNTLILGLPVLFLPALLLALLYLIWAGSYSSYNYHNNYPNSFGTHGGSAVGFGHYGNGLKGHGHFPGHSTPSHGKFRKTDRMGEAASTSQAYLTHKVNQATPNVLESIHKMSSKGPIFRRTKI